MKARVLVVLSMMNIVLYASQDPCINKESLVERMKGTDQEFLAFINEKYPELARLTEPVKASPDGGAQQLNNVHSPSLSLFGKQHIEYDRTAVGLLAVKWVISNNYEQFVANQAPAKKLKPESFKELREATLALIKKNRLEALVTSLACNDLGKVKSFVNEIEARSVNKEIDHDNILLEALRKYPELVPSFQKLSDDDKHIIVKGMSAQFNLGQFVQAENLPANLQGLKKLSEDELIFNHFHILYDVAGALGHVSSNGCMLLNEPTYQFFAMALQSIKMLPNKSLMDVYNHYLRARAALWGKHEIKNDKDRAFVRLGCMARCESSAEFDQVKAAFENKLLAKTQDILCKALNKNGVTDRGVLLYYGPAVICNARSAYKENPGEGIAIGLRYLAKVLSLASSLQKNSAPGVTIIDCADLAQKMKAPTSLSAYQLHLEPVGNDFKVVMKTKE